MQQGDAAVPPAPPPGARYAPFVPHDNAPEQDIDATVIGVRPARLSRWKLVSDAAEYPLFTRNVIGRNPVLPPGYDGKLIALTDGTKAVSKTHARIEIEGSTVWITDLNSTNGTFLSFQLDDGPAVQECEPGDDYEMRLGDTLTLGNFDLVLSELDLSGIEGDGSPKDDKSP